MKKLLFLGYMFLAGTLIGQTHMWYYNYNNEISEEGNDIVYGDDGYIYVAGIEYTDIDYNIVVIKLNKEGSQEWVYTYEGLETGVAGLEEIHYGSDGNIYVCGFTENSAGYDKYLVFSVTTDGNFRWDYLYDISGTYSGFAYSVVYGGNGMVYAAGQADYDFLVTGINAATGEQEWTYQFDGGCPYALCDDVANALTMGDDGNIYAAGYTLESDEKQLVVASLTPDGNENWKYLHPASGIGSSIATDVVWGTDGRIYASCYIAGDIGVICLNSSGQYQWNCNADGPGPEPSFGETCYELIYGIDNNIYVVGRTAGRNDQVDTNLDVTVLKVGQQGELEWFYRYEGLYGTFDMAFSIVQTPDTNVHVAAYSCGLLAEANIISMDHRTSRDLWVMRYIGPDISMDVAYAITADEDGYLYVTGYDYKSNRLHDIYVLKLDPPRHSDGYYNLEGYGTSGKGYAVLETPDTNYVIAGYQGASFSSSSYNMRLIKTDINGDTLWTKNFGGSNEDRAYDVALCPDNGLILTGFTKSYGAGGKDLYVVKTGPDGNMQWEKYYGFDTDEEGRSITATSDGGYLIAGKSTKYDGAGDLWLMKINAQGDSLWTKWYGGDRRDEVGQVYLTSDGGFIFAGTIGVAETIGYQTDIYVMKLNSEGDTIWTRQIGNHDYSEEGGDIMELEDGSFMLAGYYAWHTYLAKLDAEGNTLWEKEYGGDQSTGFKSIARKKDGNFIMAMEASSPQILVYVATVDPDGNFLGADTAAFSPGWVLYPTTGRVVDACPTSYGGYMATGDGKISGAGMLNWNIILYRKGGKLTLLPPLGISENLFPGVQSEVRNVKSYPNPFSKSTTIEFKLENTETVNITIFDITGKTVFSSGPVEYSRGEHQLQWSPESASNGVYFCRIQAGTTVLSGKLILLNN